MTEPPMLRAAMLAVGAQYSSDPCAKRKARILLDRCIKRLDAREVETVPEPPRLSDYQAIFLLEVATQYRARRAVQCLSKRFEEMYQKFSQEFNRRDTSSVLDSIAALNLHDGSAVIEHWQQWIALSSQQRLLQCCYILETQQTTLLARPPKTSVIHVTGYELPFPAPATLWEAQSASEWAMAASHYHHLPSDLIEATTSMPSPFDRFQSSLLIAAHYNHFENYSPFLSVPNPNMGAIDHLVDNSSITQHHLFTAKLLQGTPIRALLAVSGESWILSEKVTSMQSFSSFRNTLKTWVNELWNTSPDSGSLIVKEAVKAAIGILRLGLLDDELPVEFGVDMGMYYASLVIWAVTVAATIRTRPHGQPVRHPSPHPLSSHRSSHYPSSSTHLNPSNSNSPNPLHSSNLGLHQPPMTSSPTSPSNMLRTDVTNHSLNFLQCAAVEIDLLSMAPQWPQDVAQWQQGCVALLQWTKLRIRKGSPEGRDSVISAGPTSAGTGRGSDSMGELLDSVLTNLEKVMGRGWDSWVM